MITITRGQWFPLTIGNIRYGGAAFDLQGASEVSASLVSTLGAKSPLKFEITAYNELSAVSDGSLSAGKYSIEVSCKGADGKSYRMKSPEAIIEVSSSTTPSVGSTSVRVSGDEWELTADVEMHEAQARTYMSLLEEARKAAMDAADRANSTVDGVTKAVEDAGKAAEEANKAAADAEKAKTLSEEQTAKAAEAETARVEVENARVTAESARATVENARVTAENERVQSEQSRKSAETERVSAEEARMAAETARASAETQRANSETQRETDFASTKTACETATANATAATDKANTATASATSAANAATEATDKANAAAVKATSAANAAVEAEQGRVEAEQGRVTAETAREQGFTEKAAHLEELLQYIKDNHLEPDVKLAEAIKNTINGTDEFVYLDTNDGNVKSMPNTNKLGANVASVYYAGKRSIRLGESCKMLSAKNTLVRNLDLSGWDFEAATDMTEFLNNASALKTLTLQDNMTLANVTSMVQCFFSCGSLQALDTSKWTLANVTNMVQCFSGCGSLQALDTSKWTLANVKDMSYCFYQCTLLREIDLTSCDITKCKKWDAWLTQTRLETLRIGLIDFSLCGTIDFLNGSDIRELTGTLRGIKNNFTAKSNRMTRDSCMVVINGLETVTEAKTLTLGANNKPVSLGGKGNDPISDADLKIATDKGWTVAFA